MDSLDYKQFYNEVGRMNGWDFSRLKVTEEGVKWDFYNEVIGLSKPSDLLLDIGTGGGENLLRIADSALLLVGIDHAEGMIEMAAKNLGKTGKSNVRFLPMDAAQLDFPAEFFNVISCRHSEFDAGEVARVLANDGVFLTQQVSEHDKFNIKEAFGRGQSRGVEKGSLITRCIRELKEAGFTDVQTFEYDAAEYYQTAEDLIFLLKHTPIIPGFGQTKRDFLILRKFIEHHQMDKGIKTNSERFMIIARK